MPLANEAVYFPLEKGLYEVAPGLRPFGTDFGNGDADKWLFQFDTGWSRFHKNISDCRTENLSKYYLTSNYRPEVSRAITQFLLARLVFEHPEHFKIQQGPNDTGVLSCALTGDTLFFDTEFNLVESRRKQPAGPEYVSAFDAIASQVPEDLCVVSYDPASQKNWLSAVHLCCSGHWSPAEKIGKDFAAIHAPVPGIEKITATAQSIVESMIHKGPFVRFVWGLESDAQLNHHPQAPLSGGRGRTFSSAKPAFYLRVERQVTWGFADRNAALFTIRVHYIEGEKLLKNPQQKQALYSALKSMSPESQSYKGLKGSMDKLLNLLAK